MLHCCNADELRSGVKTRQDVQTPSNFRRNDAVELAKLPIQPVALYANQN